MSFCVTSLTFEPRPSFHMYKGWLRFNGQPHVLREALVLKKATSYGSNIVRVLWGVHRACNSHMVLLVLESADMGFVSHGMRPWFYSFQKMFRS